MLDRLLRRAIPIAVLSALGLIVLMNSSVRAQSWVRIPPASSYDFYGCWFDPAHPDRGSITGYYISAGDLIPFVYTTTDGGVTLNLHLLSFSHNFLASQAIWYTDSNNGYIAGTGIVKTTNGGANWNLLVDYFQASGFFYDIAFASPDTGYAVGETWFGPSGGTEGMLFRTTDAGANWVYRSIAYGGPEATMMSAVARPSRDRLYAGSFSYAYQRTFFRSTNDGDTWTSTGFSQNIAALSFTSRTQGYAGTDTGIWRTTDGGDSWTQVLATASTVNGLRITPAIGFAVCSDGSIYQTADGGLTWQPMTSPVPGTILNDVQILSPSLAYAVGAHGTLLRYDNVTSVDRPEAVSSGPNSLFGSLPNPISGAAMIEYRVPESGPVSLALFDVKGRAVRRIVDGFQEAGRRRVAFQRDGLPEGIYLCRLTAGNAEETRKVVIRR